MTLPAKIFTVVVMALATVQAAEAEILEDTYLLGVFQGSNRADRISSFKFGGFELADGSFADFRDWYSTDWPETSLQLLTRVDENLGLVWGFSTGESGEKYSMDPGLWLGFVYTWNLSRHSILSLSALTMVGGHLRERSCIADYGAIGGLQEVNCRLAAGILPPSDTLSYLVDEGGFQETRISLRFEFRF